MVFARRQTQYIMKEEKGTDYDSRVNVDIKLRRELTLHLRQQLNTSGRWKAAALRLTPRALSSAIVCIFLIHPSKSVYFCCIKFSKIWKNMLRAECC